MAERAGATVTEVKGSHVIMIFRPDVVAGVIKSAAATVSRPVAAGLPWQKAPSQTARRALSNATLGVPRTSRRWHLHRRGTRQNNACRSASSGCASLVLTRATNLLRPSELIELHRKGTR